MGGSEYSEYEGAGCLEKHIYRVNDKGEIHSCGICDRPVELIKINQNPESWMLKCDCGFANIPQWCIVDGYMRRKFEKNFELFAGEVPRE